MNDILAFATLALMGPNSQGQVSLCCSRLIRKESGWTVLPDRAVHLVVMEDWNQPLWRTSAHIIKVDLRDQIPTAYPHLSPTPTRDARVLIAAFGVSRICKSEV
jgi:hypothetical protein